MNSRLRNAGADEEVRFYGSLTSCRADSYRSPSSRLETVWLGCPTHFLSHNVVCQPPAEP